MSERRFIRPQHDVIARVLGALRTDFVLDCECWFGGGTAIVMRNGEYRLSLGVDFLCSSRAGYARMRAAVVAEGPSALFDGPVGVARDFRCDRYGLRSILEFEDQRIRFEVVSEGRVDLDGAIDPVLGCPTLSLSDQFVEKLLANSDRGMDPSTAHRDVIDLGVLAMSNAGKIPPAAVEKACAAYPDAIERVLTVARPLLAKPRTLSEAAITLQMDPALARRAVRTAITSVTP